MGDVERRVLEAHATLEKMRNDFEVEREGYAVSERDLRARLTAETERLEQFEAHQQALQEHLTALRAQNESLLEAYVSAQRLSTELATAFERALPEVPPLGEIKAIAPKGSKSSSKVEKDEPIDATDDSVGDENGHAPVDGELRAASGSRAKA